MRSHHRISHQTQIWNHKTLLFVVLLILKACSCSLCASTVNFLPGFQGPLPFQLETGYVGVGESGNDKLFYYFVKSERNPQKDPLILWLTGGPGCSAWSGLVYEIGPLNYKIKLYNGSLPTLVLNQYSWTKVSNIIFVDSPVGTGFSYTKSASASQLGDFSQVRNLLQFFKSWLLDHSEFISNSIYIAGDSYSGTVAPILVQEISNGIEEGVIPHVNLKGYIIGNPITDESAQENYRIPFAHGMALISDELYKSLERSCRGEYVKVDPNNTECLKYLHEYKECTSGIDTAHILEPKCPFASPKPGESRISERRLLNNNSRVLHLIYSDSPLPKFGCREYDHLLSVFWANDPHVQEALHVKKGSIGKWQRCNNDIRNFVTYKKDVSTSVPYYANLSTKGFQSLIFSGDHDMVVPFLWTQAWIRSLNYSIVDEWRPWIVQSQVAGYTRSYSNQMTFATVKGGGHTAPQYKPKECFAMFQRWIDHGSL